MFGLEDKYIDFIKLTLKRYLKNPQAKVYIFGSRAKGKYKEYSDIDIAIDVPDFTLDEKLKIQSVFENSTFPYEIDIIDLNGIQEEFKNLIKNDLVLLDINQ